MYTKYDISKYDIFEEHPDGKMWKGVAEGRDTAIEKLQELSHQAAHPVMALNLQTSETLRWQPESAKCTLAEARPTRPRWLA